MRILTDYSQGGPEIAELKKEKVLLDLDSHTNAKLQRLSLHSGAVTSEKKLPFQFTVAIGRKPKSHRSSSGVPFSLVVSQWEQIQGLSQCHLRT